MHEPAHGTKRQFAQCKATSGVGGKADLPVERPDFSSLTPSRHFCRALAPEIPPALIAGATFRRKPITLLDR